MTRGQVARYLGKSIATVRRIEGRLLHPRRDARGAFQFDLLEVRELRAAIDNGDVRLSGIDFRREHDRSPSPTMREKRDDADAQLVRALRQELEELRAIAREAVELFYLVCPVAFLAELDPEVLDAFDAVTACEPAASE